MSANVLIPNDYYTLYCKRLITSDAPIQTAETWCYYPSNPNGQGQVIAVNDLATNYNINYNVSAVSKNVVVNEDGSIDIVQEGIYRLEGQLNASYTGTSISLSLNVLKSGTVYFTGATTVCPQNIPTTFYYSIFFTIPKGNLTPVKLQTFLYSQSGSTGSNLNVSGANLSLVRIEEAPAS